MRQLVLALVLVAPVFADDSPVEPTKKAKAKPKPRPTPTPRPCPPWPPCAACPDPVPCPQPEPPTFDELPVVDKVTPPVVVVVKKPEPGFGLQVLVWGELDRADGVQHHTVGGRVVVDGPVARAVPRLRVGVTAGVSATPSRAFDLAADTFSRSTLVRGGLGYRLSRANYDGQHVTTNFYIEGGVVSALTDFAPDRHLRQFGTGFEFGVLMGEQKAHLRIGYARDERGGYIGFGQVAIAGEVPLGGKGLVFGGDALINLSRATVSPQRDILRLFVGVDLTRLYRVITRD